MKDIIISKLKNIIYLCIVLSIYGCEDGFLDAKPSKSLLVPHTARDYQALLDNAFSTMNITPYLGEIAGDDFIITEGTYQSYQDLIKNAYIWADRIYPSPSVSDWDTPHKQIFYANVVLDGLKDMSSNDDENKNLKGMALFYRGWALFQLAQTFTLPYDSGGSEKEMGLPIRIQSDVTLTFERGTLQETYRQIEADILEAIRLLKVEQLVPTRPSKAAAYAFMARLQLIKQNYKNAKVYSDSTLAINNFLIDYNTLDSNLSQPMPPLFLTSNRNPEILFLSILIPNNYFSTNNTLVDSTLYYSYPENDLRRVIFFTKDKIFKGSYMGIRALQFSGLATDEIYLIRSECLARLGDIDGALKDLNTLLNKRFKSEQYIPFGKKDPDEVLLEILNERRKELISRGIRWSDLKRLNQDSRYSKALIKKVSGQEFTLLSDSKRYAFPIPDAEIDASRIPQNER